MFGSLGAPELLIIGAVIILIFGVGKISGLGKELGSSIKEFRRAVKDEDAEQAKNMQQMSAPPQQQYIPPQQPQQYAPPQQQQYTPPPAQQQPPQQPGETKTNLF
jgi:TatA/E family protein of Tat protein translocase